MANKEYNLKKLRKKLETELDEERYEHTLGVAKTAQFLASLYDVDSTDAYVAGLLHDCAKNISHKEKVKLCDKNNVSISACEKENPSLLHAKVGAIIAKEDYGIDNEDILQAISSHTTGRPSMSELEKIVFVADYIEPGRSPRPGLDLLRASIADGLDSLVLKILENTLEYLADSAKAIDPTTKDTYDFYCTSMK